MSAILARQRFSQLLLEARNLFGEGAEVRSEPRGVLVPESLGQNLAVSALLLPKLLDSGLAWHSLECGDGKPQPRITSNPRTPFASAPERRENTLKGSDGFHLKATSKFWQ